ncbi:MAG: acyl-CoA dehydrogenase [Rickettsiales bacterium]|jgi:alkylation response protein AidB-like acyl-CoA dehydrogenase|nr:acyl-CoA dehydrogenase [Rickettsiales bacterium]
MSYIPYQAPLDDMRFVLHQVLGLEAHLDSSVPVDLVDAILEEAGKFAGSVLSPINVNGDREGAKWKEGHVTTASGFKEAYRLFVENGWNAVPFPTEFDGQGLPWMVSTAISELWSGANMAFGLCSLLTQGSIELLLAHGTDAQKAIYLAKLISGEWTGTMCLTEPHAGSDVGVLTTRAVPEGDYYRISGTKIFITYGEHDMAENIIHMVLARLPDAPEGTKGISLFIVPKILEDGTRNDVQCVSLEHKLGIHGSPTAVLSFGDKGGAIGYLIGEKHKGMRAMFTMMNNARLAVGIEGVAIGENSLQQATAYANERVQGKVTIIHHPDVKRMLLSIRAETEAMRVLTLYLGKQLDHVHRGDNESAQALQLLNLLIPVCKSHATDKGFWAASEALQVFGGMGFIEETGIAQNLRDSRIAMIYEGTNGIQAQDLVMRKLNAEEGALYRTFEAELDRIDQTMQKAGIERGMVQALAEARKALTQATVFMQGEVQKNSDAAAFIATPYLELFGIVTGGYMLGWSLAALARNSSLSAEFVRQKQETVRFYIQYILSKSGGFSKIFESSF